MSFARLETARIAYMRRMGVVRIRVANFLPIQRVLTDDKVHLHHGIYVNHVEWGPTSDRRANGIGVTLK